MMKRWSLLFAIGFLACGGGSAEQAPATGASGSPATSADACTCRAWETVDFSFQDMATGTWCRGGKECAQRYGLKGNECANPGSFERKSWCYVPPGCPQGNVSVIAGLYWRSCE